jgi:putative membrane protein
MKLSPRGHRWVLTAPLLLLAAACGGGDDREAGRDAAADTAPATTQGPPPAPAPAPAPAGTLTDGNIVAILGASGRSEIVPSDSVVHRVEHAEVKRFARHMITQHTALNDTVSMVAQQNGITPVPDAGSAQLDSTSAAAVQRLRGLSGAELDRAFMQYMVTSHEGALKAVNEKLLPAVQNPQLRTAIEKDVRPVVRAHLAEAHKVLRSLGPP